MSESETRICSGYRNASIPVLILARAQLKQYFNGAFERDRLDGYSLDEIIKMEKEMRKRGQERVKFFYSMVQQTRKLPKKHRTEGAANLREVKKFLMDD